MKCVTILASLCVLLCLAVPAEAARAVVRSRTVVRGRGVGGVAVGVGRRGFVGVGFGRGFGFNRGFGGYGGLGFNRGIVVAPGFGLGGFGFNSVGYGGVGFNSIGYNGLGFGATLPACGGGFNVNAGFTAGVDPGVSSFQQRTFVQRSSFGAVTPTCNGSLGLGY